MMQKGRYVCSGPFAFSKIRRSQGFL